MTYQEAVAKINLASEEYINTYLNRPQADLFVAFFYRFTSISANQVTMLAILAGLAAAFFFAYGTLTSIFIGGLLYQLSIVFDCADGQLARLKGTSSEFGRILDGISDYIVGLATLGGCVWACITHYDLISPLAIIPYSRDAVIPIALLGFASLTIHVISYDLVKTKFSSIVKTGTDQIVKDKMEMEKRYANNRNTLSWGQKTMMRLYRTYVGLQEALLPIEGYKRLYYSEPERIAVAKREENFLRLWSFLGPNTHLIIVVVFCLFRDMVFAFWIFLVPFNLYYLAILIYTKRHMAKGRVRDTIAS
jgi:hypothetical protein